MDEQPLFQEVQRLRQEINFHNYRYNVLDDQSLTTPSSIN